MKKITFTVILILLHMQSWAQGEPAGLRRYAIFTGSNNGGEERVKLVYAETDAIAMYNVLTEIGGLAPNDTILLSDPDVNEIKEAFSRIKANIERDKKNSRRSEFIFYYSGHSDDSGILPGGELFEYSHLRQEIDKMGTEVKIAVLDSCSSGAFTRLKGGVKKAPFLIDESVDTEGHAFLTSSSENEAAQESDAIEGSFFTHYLITGLRGAADSTQDGTVSLTEAYSFAADETLARTTSSIAGAQHPSYSINLTGSGDLVLTDLREIISSISIDKEIEGRIYFRDNAGRLVVEFRKRAGMPVSISLPGGIYQVELETDRNLAVTMISVSRGEIQLTQSAFSPAERTFARTRGDEAPAEDTTESDLERKMAEIREDINSRVKEEAETEIEKVEESLENKIEQIRGIIDETFDQEPETPPTPSLDYKVLGISFAPTSASSNDVVNLSLSFIGRPYALYGLSLGFMNMTVQDAVGIQVGAISSQAGRDQYGALISGIYNIVNRDLLGAAISGVFNINSNNMKGFQASGVFNISRNLTYGVQTAGVFNITNGTMIGFQAAGVFNYSREQFHGVQVAGVFNNAKNINGVQIGLLNIGGVVNGMQIGLININDDINGLPLGLITISKNGIMDFGGWYENSGFFYTGIQTGSKNFYNFAYAAFPVETVEPALALGIGIGARINLGSFYIDLDTSVKSVSNGTDFTDLMRNTFSGGLVNSVYPNARISAGLKIFRVLSLYGGMSLDMHFPGLTNRSDYFHNTSKPLIIHDPKSGADVMEIHPHWYGGLKINL